MNDTPLLLKVRKALTGVIDPSSGVNIVAQGRISGLGVSDDGAVRFTLEANGNDREHVLALLDQAKAAASAVEGVTRVGAIATEHLAASASRPPQSAPPQSARRTAPPAPPPGAGGHNNPMGLRKNVDGQDEKQALPHVKNVIAVASGKGGVGKSTIAANLAVALAKAGYKTGLMDADIYGPSLPTLFGLSGRPPVENGVIIPPDAFGVTAMSIGLLVDTEQAIAWRGPMVMGAVRQLMTDVGWGKLDVLIIDTPPGTGDVHLSLAQSKLLTGAVIISTPQEMALADMRRGVALFRKTNVPVLGVIENMAFLEGPDGERQYIFGEGGAEQAAKDLDTAFLGAIPIQQHLRESADRGTPIIACEPENPAARQITEVAKKIAAHFSL